MQTKFLTSTLLSVLLLTTTVTADTNIICKGGKCFIDISKFSSNNSSKIKHEKVVFRSKKIRTRKKLDLDNGIKMVSLDKSKYVKQKDEKLKPISQDEIETVVLAPEKYIMTIEEIQEYELAHIQLSKPAEDINNKILKKTKPLPKSEFYCKNNKKPVYRNESNSYECA